MSARVVLLVGHSVLGGFECCVLFAVLIVTMVTRTRLAAMVVSHPCPPVLIPLLLPECVLGLPTTRAESRASQVPSALANDSLTAVRHTRPVQRQNCREHVRFFRNMLVYLLSSGPTTNTNCFRYEPTASYAVCCNSHDAVPAKGTSVPTAVPLSQGTISTKGTRASCAVRR